jgi:hypothetical protein
MNSFDHNEFDLNAISRAAIASMNAYADSILQEIRMKHVEFMQSRDWEDEECGRITHIASLILPHESLEDWWSSLSNADRVHWLDTYQEYQYGSDRSEKLHENYFDHCVMSFLSSRKKLRGI